MVSILEPFHQEAHRAKFVRWEHVNGDGAGMLLRFRAAIAPEDMNQALLRTAATIVLTMGVLFGGAGCSDPKLVRHRAILDDAGQAVDYVCVVPMYGKMSGVSFALEGARRNTAENAYLKRPFNFRSGEDFAAQIIPNDAHVLFIPGLMALAFGDAVSPLRFLLVREGFEPLLLRGHEKHMREPLMLRRSPEKLPDELLELLTEQRDDQAMLRKYFKPNESVRTIQFEYSNTDVDVLRSCLGKSEVPWNARSAEKPVNGPAAPFSSGVVVDGRGPNE
jgi:hypothetical protein